MFWLKFVKSIIKILHSNVSEDEAAAGFAIGSIMGLLPFASLINVFMLFLIIILNVNYSAAALAIIIFGIVGSFTDPAAGFIGNILLAKMDILTPFWSYLYNVPLIPFTRFNNTVVLGSLVIALFLAAPVFIFSKKFILYYRANLANKVEKLKIVKVLGLNKLINIYSRFNQ